MSENSPQPGIRVKKTLVRGASIVATLVASLMLVGVALADLEIPVLGIPVFVQTSGRLAPLGVGDYRTNAPAGVDGDAGDDLPHEIAINVSCLPNAVVQFDLFDPEVYRESTAAPTIDEPRTGAQVIVADCRTTADCDPATFTLLDPSGATIATQTYNSSAATNEQWVTLSTVTLPAAPVLGTDCGSYTLRSQTGDLTQPATQALNNDDNAWRFRLVGVDDGGPGGGAFPVEDGPDALPGTGDELWIGLQAVSYQHSSPTEPSCQDFFWFADFGETNMFMLNFDMDGNDSVTYVTPSGTTVTGTVSNQTVWNDTAPQQQTRPTFAQMDSFSPPGDVIGDAIASPEAGLWDATICVRDENQYSLEVPNNTIFLTAPQLPDVTIAKTDGVTAVSSPGTTTYTITLTNTGLGAAMPLPGTDPEVVDQLPAGMSFSSCTVNAPLVGSCTENPAGSGTVEIQLEAQSATVPAYLPGSSNAPDNTGTITVVADVDPGLAAGTSLTNTATVDFTDIYANNHEPTSASDVDFVAGGAAADLSLDKTVDDNRPTLGQIITYTLTVTNAGPDDATGVEVTDVLPGGVLFVSATPSQGSYNEVTGIWTVGNIAANDSASLQIQVSVNAGGTITNYAQVSAVNQLDPNSSPGNGSTDEDDDDTAVITVGGGGGRGGGGGGGGGDPDDPGVSPLLIGENGLPLPQLLPELGYRPVEEAQQAPDRPILLALLLIGGGLAALVGVYAATRRRQME